MNQIDAENKENLEILNNYILQIIEHSSKCQHCAMLHDENVCFLAYECIKNDFYYMKEED